MLCKLTILTSLVLTNFMQVDSGVESEVSQNKTRSAMAEVKFVAPTPSDKVVMSFPATTPYDTGNK